MREIRTADFSSQFPTCCGSNRSITAIHGTYVCLWAIGVYGRTATPVSPRRVDIASAWWRCPFDSKKPASYGFLMQPAIPERSSSAWQNPL